MDTWAITSNIKCGHVTLLDIYLQQEEARERTELFSRKLHKARALYAFRHPNGSDTDDDSYENETRRKRFCTENQHNKNNLSEKQDQPEDETTDGLNMRPTVVIQIDSDDDADDGDEQAKATKSPGDDDGIEVLEKKGEIVDLCTPPKANDSSVAEYQSTPTTSRKRFRKRRLNFTM